MSIKLHQVSPYEKGFTLIELMIVVSIIGILASIALPAYQDFTKRAHISEGLTMANGAKIGIVDFYSVHGRFPSNNASIGMPTATDITGQAVSSISVNTSKVTISYNNKISPTNTSIVFKASIPSNGTSIHWNCKSGGTVPVKYRPQNCR